MQITCKKDDCNYNIKDQSSNFMNILAALMRAYTEPEENAWKILVPIISDLVYTFDSKFK